MRELHSAGEPACRERACTVCLLKLALTPPTPQAECTSGIPNVPAWSSTSTSQVWQRKRVDAEENLQAEDSEWQRKRVSIDGLQTEDTEWQRKRISIDGGSHEAEDSNRLVWPGKPLSWLKPWILLLFLGVLVALTISLTVPPGPALGAGVALSGAIMLSAVAFGGVVYKQQKRGAAERRRRALSARKQASQASLGSEQDGQKDECTADESDIPIFLGAARYGSNTYPFNPAAKSNQALQPTISSPCSLIVPIRAAPERRKSCSRDTQVLPLAENSGSSCLSRSSNTNAHNSRDGGDMIRWCSHNSKYPNSQPGDVSPVTPVHLLQRGTSRVTPNLQSRPSMRMRARISRIKQITNDTLGRQSSMESDSSA